MTKERASKIIEIHRAEKYYSVSALQVGEVEVLEVYENGFTFKRTTEYVETLGIYEENYETNDPFDNSAYSISEVTTKRF